MQITALVAMLGTASAAVMPRDTPPSGVQITGLAFAGTGCPAGSVAGQLSSDLSLLTLAYDRFVAQAGSGIQPAENRKNCQLNVKLKYPSGWQFSVFKADYRGYADIPAGATGTCKATYYFSGENKQITSTLELKGPTADNYLKSDQFGVESTVWSPCGIEGLLNINSEVRIAGAGTKGAQMTVDSTDLSFKQLHYLQWQKCKKA